MLNILISLVIGAVCGWLAGIIMKSKGGFVRNAIIGVIGGFVGGTVFGFLIGTSLGFVGSVIGACLVIWVYEKFIQK